VVESIERICNVLEVYMTRKHIHILAYNRFLNSFENSWFEYKKRAATTHKHGLKFAFSLYENFKCKKRFFTRRHGACLHAPIKLIVPDTFRGEEDVKT